MFIPSPEKKIITTEYDKPLLAELSGNLGRKLQYFGLPGPRMNDIIVWHEYLSSCICIERDEKQKDILYRTSILSDACNFIKFEIILDGLENYMINKLLDSKYGLLDVVNLDYFGPSITMTKDGKSYRQESLEKLFTYQKQWPHAQQFILFITSSLRNKDDGLIESMLDDISKDLSKENNVVVPTKDGSEQDKLRVVIPYLTRAAAAREKWEIELVYSLTYRGTSNIRMVHFAFIAKPTKSLVVRHPQSMVEICSIPLKEINLSADHI